MKSFIQQALLPQPVPVQNKVSARSISSCQRSCELPASITSPAAHPALRPSSPTTTLKNSIASADQKLQDQRNRLKRNRKDHKVALANIKKELDNLTSRLGNAGGSDERQRQRVLQFNQTIRQAEEATADLEIQLEMLGDIPEEEANEAATVKQEWKKERSHKNSIENEFENAKAEAERQISSIKSDIASVIQKRERLQQRQSRVNEQHDKLTAANNEDMSVRTRKQHERFTALQVRAETESQYRNAINNLERRAAEYNAATNQLSQSIMVHEQAQHQSVPATPESVLAGIHGLSSQSTPYSSFTYPSLTSHVNSTPGSLRNGRGRSSSMLSNVSGFTDGFDEPVSSIVPVLTNPFHHALMNGKGSHSGSGSSGSSSQSSSQRDPMSPVPNAKPMAIRTVSGSAGMSPVNGGR